MDLLNIRTKVITEINLIPEDKLEELYNFIHYWRLNGESSPAGKMPALQEFHNSSLYLIRAKSAVTLASLLIMKFSVA
ncbi:hypothetical protein ANA_C10540 [Anabaena sp. 90]|uniref:hypothetical protein n=1 Tax=Anabaena sp. 90 TaxID=46234 RepID=UPI00029B7222|nr:hypothetical protein [Anabaena sp. 90]AFW93340.1 hypothetical protein ANA_C10540 [Anabaena sp. 90]MBO1051739.1 hypothetical protein [Dolichospermum sp. DET73]